MQEQASKDDKQVFAASMAKNISVDLITLAGQPCKLDHFG